MKVFLAGSGWDKIIWRENDIYDFYRLESYHYLKDEVNCIHKYNMFLLDSGAFTFLTSKRGKKINWEQYVIEYGQFIKKHNIKYFFELDIDPIVGIKEVERLRAILEKEAGRPCIPVWHKSRGLDYWKQMVKEYSYVAIGGIVTKEIKRKEHDIFLPLLRIAKANNCKVHGLGYTNLTNLKKYPFYSVDSTSWLSGNRFGHAFIFDGRELKQAKKKKEGQRAKTTEIAKHNFKQWYLFSKYADKHL